MKSAVRISQLVSQRNVWGIDCEIQGVSTEVLAVKERQRIQKDNERKDGVLSRCAERRWASNLKWPDSRDSIRRSARIA